MNKRIVSLLILCITLITIVGTCVAKEYKFPDIAWESTDRYGKTIMVEYYAREITQAANIGFIDGYPDGTFKPLNDISREEFVKMLLPVSK